MSLTQKSTDGTNMHIKDIVNPMSDYIQIYTPEDEFIAEDAVPASTEDVEALGGGYDGDEVELLKDKFINTFTNYIIKGNRDKNNKE